MSEHDEIIAEAREKYTVHNCGQCEFRKSCDLGINCFDSAECRERRQSIMLGFGIEDGCFTKLLDRLEAAHKREVETSRAISEKSSAVGNAAKMREALERLREWVLMDLNENAFIADSSGNYMKLIKGTIEIVNAALSAPPRNCDIGTPEEQSVRMAKFCREQYKKTDGVSICSGCQFHNMEGLDCQFAWAQTPYESEVKS